ncbi:WD40 repeat-like protein [Patellaria atrata CBS 101060]|uniref:WD40 repeat-like protein n=1 Tax=Patellaria atrata CBS 101060 TaxID=1346257 RepID=A0A9P4SHK9_9PEZI|nr:WD40 repeat-like protein [Patellaria atrata CBS 101060]
MDATPTESEMSVHSESFSYPSYCSTSQTLSADPSAAPSPVPPFTDVSNSHPHGAIPDRMPTSTHMPVMPSYTTLAQLSYAPATKTTVVTTTTTTTTSFPPLIIQAPRNISERDPKLYPLASAPTPSVLQNICFDLNGRPVLLQESDGPQQSLEQYQQSMSALQKSNGILRTVQNKETQFETPDRTARTGKPVTTSASHMSYQKLPAKRSISPVSITEAAEIASLQRRRKKAPRLRPSQGRNREVLDDSIPATPETDTGELAHFKVPKAKIGAKQANNKSSMRQSNLSRQTSFEDARHGSPQPSRILTRSGSIPGPSCLEENRSPTFNSHISTTGIAATPPIAESDLEPIEPLESDTLSRVRTVRPMTLDTVSAQDASLPSPSLSPITAAANIAHQTGFSGMFPTGIEDEELTEVSNLDISQGGRARGRPSGSQTLFDSQTMDNSTHTRLISTPNPQLLTPTMMDIPTMVDSFDAMPDEMKTYIMFKFLQRCAKPTLRFVSDVVNPALKCDFLQELPYELSLNVLKYLDAKSLCNAAQVSRKWRTIVDQNERQWKDLLGRDGYFLPEGEMERAIKEGWGWQFPTEPNSHEIDLSGQHGCRSDSEAVSPPSSSSSAAYNDTIARVPNSRPKRKAAAKYNSNNKRQKRKGAQSGSKQAAQSPAWAEALETAQGPMAFANAASLAVPNPDFGLPSIRHLHLFKSLYQRHHLIRKAWMDERTTPQHIAFRAHQRHVVTCLQFDTEKILTGSDDTNIHVYDTKTGALRSKLTGHEGGVWALQYEGNILVSGSTDRSVRVWDIEKGKCLQVFQGHTSTVRCLVILKPVHVGYDENGESILMPKEPLIITGSRDSSLRVWKLPKVTDRSIYQTGPPANDHDNPYFVRALTGHHHSVRAIAAYGDTLVSGSYDCTVRVWRISTGEVVHRLSGHSQKVYSVVLDHRRNRCISGSMDNLVKVWNLDTGACLFNLEGHTSLVGLLDLSHERLVSAAADSTLRIWDPENGQCKATLGAHTGAITCFQHDGQKVISGSDRTLKMWNVKTGECIKDLLTDLSGVWQVKFNERRCVAAVQRKSLTYIEVLDFGAARDGIPASRRGRRIVVDSKGRETEDEDDVIDVENI